METNNDFDDSSSSNASLCLQRQQQRSSRMMNNCIGCVSWVPRPDMQNHPILRRWLRDITYDDYKDNNDNIDPWADLDGFRTHRGYGIPGRGYGSNVMVD